MAPTIKRIPPPPPIATNDPVFNRWLHDITAFIGSNGIDTSQIPGYDDLVATVDAHSTQIAINTSNIATNTLNIGTNSTNISTLFSTTAAHTTQINANTSNISALAARSQVLHGTTPPTAGTGIDGDWYSDTSAKHIYTKVAGTWVLIV